MLDYISNGKCGIYNILLDDYMSETDYLTDYGPSIYVYLFSSVLANKIINRETEYLKDWGNLRNLYENIFNEQKINTITFKDKLVKILNIENVNTIKYIKKGHNIKLFGEIDV